MLRLTREVRFAISDQPPAVAGKPSNSYGGFPTLGGLEMWLALRITVSGEVNLQTSYLLNIQDIDEVVRQRGIPLLAEAVQSSRPHDVMRSIFDALRGAWPAVQLDRVELVLSLFTILATSAEEFPMVRLNQKFEFSASHRLHNPDLTEVENRQYFGKCNNAAGHGHNYEVQVSVRRKDADLSNLVDLERAVKPVIDRWDHHHLNMEIPEFTQTNPTVENIAKILFGLLKPRVEGLAAVTVWETPKTWCEYSE